MHALVFHLLHYLVVSVVMDAFKLPNNLHIINNFTKKHFYYNEFNLSIPCACIEYRISFHLTGEMSFLYACHVDIS